MSGWIENARPGLAHARDDHPARYDGDQAAIDAASALWAECASVLDVRAGQARDYLRYRGIDARLVHAADVAYVHRWPSPRVGPALGFAFRDQHGVIVAVQGRALQPHVVCAHAAQGRKSLGLYSTSGLERRVLAITEAPIDALSLYVSGVDAIATGGTSFPQWLPGGLRLAHLILIATDADDPGDAFAERLRAALVDAGLERDRVVRFRPELKDQNADLVADPAGLWSRLERLVTEITS